MKKFAAFCLILMMILGATVASAAPAYSEDVEPNAVMLLDATTGMVLFEKNADERIRPASTTKIMTCILALENSDPDDVVTVGPEGDWTGSGYSLLGTKNGEKIVMKDLLTGMMLVSGNDAASAVAVHIGGSEEGFARMMNEKARELGMTGSHFVNAHGTDKDDHYVTARDMSLLTLYAVQNDEFMQIVGKATYEMPATNKNNARLVTNTNHLLRTDEKAVEGAYYEYATGIKTGSTPKAKRCLVSSAEKDGVELICLIFGDETSDGKYRWPTAQSLFDYGFENYSTIDLAAIAQTEETVNISVAGAGSGDEVLALEVSYSGEQKTTIDKTLAEEIAAPDGVTSVVELFSGSELSAPIRQGDVVGQITYRSAQSSQLLCQAELLATRDVDVAGDIAIEVTQETEQPLDEEPTAAPTAQTEQDAGAVAIGLGWLWIALGVVLIGVIVLLVISLIRSNKR